MATSPSPPAAGWYRDPSGRFEHRYWNGTTWTDRVQRGGVRTVDEDHQAPDPPEQVTAAAIFDDPAPAEVAVVAEPLPEHHAQRDDESDDELRDESEPAAPARISFNVPGAEWPLAVQVLVLGGAALMAVAAFLPWAEASSAVASFSERGIDGYGAVTLLAAAVIALAFLLLPRSASAAGTVTACAAGALAVAVYDAADLSRKADDLVARSVESVSAGVAIGLWLTIAGAAISLVGGIVALVTARR